MTSSTMRWARVVVFALLLPVFLLQADPPGNPNPPQDQTGGKKPRLACPEGNDPILLNTGAFNHTWHHHQDGTTMQCVPTDIHRQTGHTGGVALHGQQPE